MRKPAHFALLAYGALNAILYSALLPLWDGFDEPFHYAFVQHLSRTWQLPVTGQTRISGEVHRSLELAPSSHLVKLNLSFVTTFADYFTLPPEERSIRRRELVQLGDPNRTLESRGYNYEAQQAPLAYAILAPLDGAWLNAPIVSRVFRLRLVGGLIAVFAVWSILSKIGDLLSLPIAFRLLATFLAFSSQVFYATTAHIANDWLAVSLFSLIVACAIAFAREPRLRITILFSVSVAAGLLTKASLLTVLPLALGIAFILRAKRRLTTPDLIVFLAIALAAPAPWYIRNYVLYGNLTGLIHLTAGSPPLQEMIRIAHQLPLASSIAASAKASVWTGNNSGAAFSAKTVWIALALVCIAAGAWLWSAFTRKWRLAETVLAAGLICYTTGLVYAVVLFYWASKGAGIAAVPWYVEVMAPPLICGLCMGLARSGLFGRIIAILMIWLSAYMISATYLLKLIPFYSGYSGERVTIGHLWAHYAAFERLREILSNTALRPPATIFWLTGAVVALAILLAVYLSRRVWQDGAS